MIRGTTSLLGFSIKIRTTHNKGTTLCWGGGQGRSAVSSSRSGFQDSGPDPDFLRVCSPEKVWFLFKSPDLNKILTPNAQNSQWTVGMMSLALGSLDACTNPKI